MSTMKTNHALYFELNDTRFTCRTAIPYPRVTNQVQVAEEHTTRTQFVTILEYDSIDEPVASWLQNKLKASLLDDDVLQEAFLETLLLTGVPLHRQSAARTSVAHLLEFWPIEKFDFVDSGHKVSGPFLLEDNQLWQILRLYEDTQGAFRIPVAQLDSTTFEVANNGGNSWSNCAIAVPSRLAALKSEQKQLAGTRIALKDIFDLQGVRSSIGCRAYLDLYPEASRSAESILPLIEKGAIILGKTKLSMFLSREEPTEATDYQTAWNPRGDGFQSPGGSSSRSAVAVAAYPWIDIGIGSDTNGSIRRPAQCNGIFGLRPSRDAVSSKGMFLMVPYFDVPGVFARSIEKLRSFAHAWYIEDSPQKATPNTLPYKVVLLEDSIPEHTHAQTALVLKFAEGFANHLGVELHRVRMTTLWDHTIPEAAHGQSMHEYLNDVGGNTFLYTNSQSSRAFRDGYLREFGRQPFVSPFVKWRWSVGSKYSEQEHKDGMTRMKVFEKWLSREILRSDKEQVLLVSQSEDVKPCYRDNPAPQYHVQPAWYPWWIASILAAPEVTVPIGEVPFHSKISETDEYLPVVANVLSQPGSDSTLLAILSDFLQRPGNINEVFTGRRISAG